MEPGYLSPTTTFRGALLLLKGVDIRRWKLCSLTKLWLHKHSHFQSVHPTICICIFKVFTLLLPTIAVYFHVNIKKRFIHLQPTRRGQFVDNNVFEFCYWYRIGAKGKQCHGLLLGAPYLNHKPSTTVMFYFFIHESPAFLE